MHRRAPPLLSPKAHRASVKALEQKLLRHFSGSGRQLAALPPLSLQMETYYDADAITRSLLFPEREGIPCVNQEGSGRRVYRSTPPPPTSSHEDGGGTPSLLSLAQAVFELEKHRASRNRFSDFLLWRQIMPRSVTAVDANSKQMDIHEVDFGVLQRDMEELWAGDVVCAMQGIAAHYTRKRESSTKPSSSDGLGSSFHVPDEVVFLVAFSESAEAGAVGTSLQRIVSRVKSLIERGASVQQPRQHQHQHRRRRRTAPSLFPFHQVLRVIPIFIGVDVVGHSPPTAPPECLSYPHGGVYTAGAVLQCLRALAPLAVPQVDEGTSESSPQFVKRKLLLLSDAFMHSRLLADMHGGQQRSTAPADTFVLHTFPAIISDSLSAKEEEAFARYAICQLFPRTARW